MRTKSRSFYLMIQLLLVLIVSSSSLLCVGQLQWRTYVQVEVFSDGSATWVVQQRTMLTTDDDEAAFFEYLNITSFDAVSRRVRSMVDQASLVTGRSMRVENLQFTGNVTSKGLVTEGIIQYDFVWVGFAKKVGDENITVGDAFSGELDLLQDDALTVKYPSGYVPTFVYPPPDQAQESERTLTWFGTQGGLRNFGAGEPHAILESRSSSWTDAIASNMTLVTAAVVAVSSGLFGYFLGMKRARLNKTLEPKADQERVFLSELSVEDDEEKVVRLLAAAGGRMQQLAIARQCGFSESKASEVLSVMEEKGVVTRKKMGRGKIVTLVEGQKS